MNRRYGIWYFIQICGVYGIKCQPAGRGHSVDTDTVDDIVSHESCQRLICQGVRVPAPTNPAGTSPTQNLH